MLKVSTIVLLLLCGSLFAAINPDLQVYNYTLSETPAVPGHTITLTLHIHETEFGNCADRISVQLITSYPLSVSGMDTKYIDSLCLNDDEPKGTVSFDLPLDALAQSGTYPVTVITSYEQRFDTFSATNTVNIHVSGKPSFTASVVSSNPTDIYPGDKATLAVAFQNDGDGRAESVRARLVAAEGIDVKWAGKEQELGMIPSHGSASATFDIEALKDADPGPYGLTLMLDYAGEDGTQATKAFTFTLPLKERAEFTAAAPPGTILVAGEDRDIRMNLTNTGTQEARKLKVRMQPVYPFSTDGTVRYIDSLPPGGSQSITYRIHVDNDANPGGQISSLLVSFEDPQGRQFTDSEDFSLDVKTLTLTEQVISYWYVFAFIALVIAFVVLRKLYGFIAKRWKES